MPISDPDSSGLPTQTVTAQDIMAVLRGVIDPELGSDIVDLGMAKGAQVAEGGHVTITIALTTMGCPLRAQIKSDATARILELPGVSGLTIDWTELNPEEKAETMSRARLNSAAKPGDTAVPSTTKILAVASGKGGVGKSSVTVNLAVSLAQMGFAVGILDADIWGFSVPRMLGIDGRLKASQVGERQAMTPQSLPIGSGRLDVISMGLLVDDEESALLWRGLMLNRAVQHFLEDVAWAEDLAYLLIDMPPGTGDVALGLARMLPRAEMIVVTTPATGAQKVAARAISMARKSHLRVAGVIENMSVFINESGTRYELFGSGGEAELATMAGVGLLGQIPIEAAVSEGGDNGQPAAFGTGPAAKVFEQIAAQVVQVVSPPVDMQSCSTRLFDLIDAALDAADASQTAAPQMTASQTEVS